MPYSFGESTILLPGRKYDLEKVIGAAEEVLDAIALHAGGDAVLTTEHQAYGRRIPWPVPAKSVARQFWLNANTIYDGVYEPLVLDAGPISAKWYVLGRISCLYDPGRDLAVWSRGGDAVGHADPEPCVVLYGDPNADLIAAVGDILSPLADMIGLDIRLANPGPAIPGLQVIGHVAVLRFPHAVYGSGDGMVRIRCRHLTKEAR